MHQQTSPLATGTTGTSGLSGAVVDSTAAAIPGARIILDTHTGAVDTSTTADAAGRFSFSSLPAGVYRVTVEAAGFLPLVSAEVRLTPGEALALGDLELAVSGQHADIVVNATEHEIAQAQVKEEEHQRAFGILPNFYSSYIWDAAPLAPGQKFDLARHSITDPVEFASALIVAGIEQAHNTFPGYGGGPAGFGKRYGAALADHVVSRVIGSAVLPTVFHQDPRYFYMGSGTVRHRTLYALDSAVICRGDDGHRQPNYSFILGAFASGAIAYSYHASSDRGGTLILRNGFIQIGGRAAQNLVREFLLRRITPRVPAYETGKPPALPPGAPQPTVTR